MGTESKTVIRTIVVERRNNYAPFIYMYKKYTENIF